LFPGHASTTINKCNGTRQLPSFDGLSVPMALIMPPMHHEPLSSMRIHHHASDNTIPGPKAGKGRKGNS